MSTNQPADVTTWAHDLIEVIALSKLDPNVRHSMLQQALSLLGGDVARRVNAIERYAYEVRGTNRAGNADIDLDAQLRGVAEALTAALRGPATATDTPALVPVPAPVPVDLRHPDYCLVPVGHHPRCPLPIGDDDR